MIFLLCLALTIASSLMAADSAPMHYCFSIDPQTGAFKLEQDTDGSMVKKAAQEAISRRLNVILGKGRTAYVNFNVPVTDQLLADFEWLKNSHLPGSANEKICAFKQDKKLLEITARYIRESLLIGLKGTNWCNCITENLERDWHEARQFYTDAVSPYFPEVKNAESSAAELADRAFRLVQLFLVLGKIKEISQELSKKMELVQTTTQNPSSNFLASTYAFILEHGSKDHIYVPCKSHEQLKKIEGTCIAAVKALKEHDIFLNFQNETTDEKNLWNIVLLNDLEQLNPVEENEIVKLIGKPYIKI